jgi:type IV secretory pathway VirB3-like protein
MQSIRSLLLTAAGIAFMLMALVFTASLGLALAGIAAVLFAGSTIYARLSPKPVRATANRASGPDRREPRIWNDGRGTIIDL